MSVITEDAPEYMKISFPFVQPLLCVCVAGCVGSPCFLHVRGAGRRGEVVAWSSLPASLDLLVLLVTLWVSELW